MADRSLDTGRDHITGSPRRARPPMCARIAGCAMLEETAEIGGWILFARRQARAQALRRFHELRERSLSRPLLEPSDQPRHRERAAEVAGEIEHRDGDRRHMRVAFAERDVVPALLHG